jgi:hypothetical protein
VASKGAKQRALPKGPEGHCTCRIDSAINPLRSPLAVPNRTRMRSAGTSLLRAHHAACGDCLVNPSMLYPGRGKTSRS